MYNEKQNPNQYWNTDIPMQNYYPVDFGSQELQFQTMDHQYTQESEMRFSNSPESVPEEEEEPPLLEELGIDTDQIILKSVAVLNPFQGSGTTDVSTFVHDNDLAGPIVFCIAMAACIFFSGGKAQFGYVYGFAVTGCIMMYILLNLMTTTQDVTLTAVASILGYCLLPVVILSALGIFISLRNPVGYVLSLVAVVFCSMSASRFFVSLLGDTNQRILIAYPCALLYGVFDLITIF
ncbi:protein YIPF7 [Anabrus simplex]|uniref:protein YIPF7 n=1 Tax=Anabrus simplex TaxID=316456 RepID=UPI0035A2B985